MILNFEDFVNESYLKSGRHLLYHYTSRLDDIMKTDLLRTSKPAIGDNAICFTRSSYFEEHAQSERLVIDSDLLKIDGYNVYPIDEIILSYKDSIGSFSGYTKANPHFRKRKIIHKTALKQNLGKYGGLEWEYEERCFKNIKNIGKYIVGIDITYNALSYFYKDIKNYLEKYPHIEINELKMNKLYDRSNLIDIDKYYQEQMNKASKTSSIYY